MRRSCTIAFVNRREGGRRPAAFENEVATRPQAAIIAYENLMQLGKGAPAREAKPCPSEIELYTSPLATAAIQPMSASMSSLFPEARIIERYHYSLLMTLADTHNKGARFALISVTEGSELDEAIREQDGLEFSPLLEFSVMAKVRTQSPLAQQDVVTLDDLQHHPLAFVSGPALEELLEDIVDEDTMEGMSGGQWPSTFPGKARPERQGSAIGFATSLCHRFSAKEFVTVPLETHPRVSIGSLRNADAAVKPGEVALGRFFREKFAAMRSLPF